MSNPLGGVTAEQAGAGLSALNCPTHHANAVPVQGLGGERVATLCPGCDRQLPADWKTPAERKQETAEWVETMEREHRETHHGHPAFFLFKCRLCGEECNPGMRMT